jgi:hypothetical protein
LIDESILDECYSKLLDQSIFISKLQISSADSYQLLQEEAYTAKNSRLAASGYPILRGSTWNGSQLLHYLIKRRMQLIDLANEKAD